VLVCTLGDLLLDVIVRTESRPAAGADTPAVTHTGAGGQAANVAAWAAALGSRGRVVCKRGADAAGVIATAELDARGVEIVGPVAGGRNGVVVSLVDAEGARTMLSDRGVATDLAAEELERAWFDGIDVLHVSGYSLVAEPIAAAAEEAVRLARRAGARVSVDLPPWPLLRPPFRDSLSRLTPDVLFGNEEERDALGGLDAPVTVLKRGAHGVVVTGGSGRLELAAMPAEVLDTTGAGDALAAGLLLGGSLEEAAERGVAAAARCVGRLGSMP
jgi:sugar/nucleoside kinase (ribokinase family)